MQRETSRFITKRNRSTMKGRVWHTYTSSSFGSDFAFKMMKASCPRTQPRGTPPSPKVPWNCQTVLDGENQRSLATIYLWCLDHWAHLQHRIKRLEFRSVFTRTDVAGLWHSHWEESARRHFPRQAILTLLHHTPPPPELWPLHAVSKCMDHLSCWCVCAEGLCFISHSLAIIVNDMLACLHCSSAWLWFWIV